jgi:hypothetical protein
MSNVLKAVTAYKSAYSSAVVLSDRLMQWIEMALQDPAVLGAVERNKELTERLRTIREVTAVSQENTVELLDRILDELKNGGDAA